MHEDHTGFKDHRQEYDANLKHVDFFGEDLPDGFNELEPVPEHVQALVNAAIAVTKEGGSFILNGRYPDEHDVKIKALPRAGGGKMIIRWFAPNNVQKEETAENSLVVIENFREETFPLSYFRATAGTYQPVKTTESLIAFGDGRALLRKHILYYRHAFNDMNHTKTIEDTADTIASVNDVEEALTAIIEGFRKDNEPGKLEKAMAITKKFGRAALNAFLESSKHSYLPPF